MATQLVFNNTPISIINLNNQIWFTSSELAKALNYSNPKSVTTIYNRNSNEFTNKMTEVVNLTTSGNLQKSVRLFSLRGAHLIAMFANTEIARDFRKWVLDILDKEVQKNTPQPSTTPIPIEPTDATKQHERLIISHVIRKRESIDDVLDAAEREIKSITNLTDNELLKSVKPCYNLTTIDIVGQK